MRIPFFKMHGAGNRILVVDERKTKRAPPSTSALIRLADEENGVGFDQLMWVLPGDDNALASYRVFNRDASEVEQCGNGVRCVAWLLSRERDGSAAFTLASPAGPVDVRIRDEQQVSVSMGTPEFRPEKVPFEATGQAASYAIAVAGEELSAAVLSMGNPHCVLQVADVKTADIERLGPLLERHERFPERCNVGFMRIRNRAEIDLRVFERGVGETAACGTGACAAAVAAQGLGLVDEEVRVNLPGGQLVVSWRGNSDTVWLTGNAELVSEGSIDL
jgi:diaminopimelate epimerase